MSGPARPRGLAAWLDAVVAAGEADRRSVVIAALEDGIALSAVRCEPCGETLRFVGVARHLAAHPGEHAPGDLVPAPPAARPSSPPWSTSSCRSCGARIVWAATSGGSRMPVDAEPSSAGNIVLTAQADPCDPPLAVVVHTEREAAELADGALHTSHFATCPDAAAFRRRRKGGRS